MTGLRELLRRPLSWRLAAGVLLVAAAALIAVLIVPGSSDRPIANRPTTTSTTPAPGPIIGTPGRRADTLGPRQRAVAGRAARRFLTGYLPFLYGRHSAGSVTDVTPAVRTALRASHARVTPAQRARQPRATAVSVVGQTTRSAIATITVADGGPATYRLSVTLELRRGRWLISDLGND